MPRLFNLVLAGVAALAIFTSGHARLRGRIPASGAPAPRSGAPSP